MERIFDLPAHPLLVHFPAVAIPVAALAALALVARPALAGRWAMPTMAFTVVTTVATWFAAQSGVALAEAINAGEYLDKHETLGRTLQFMMVGQVVLLGAYLFGPGPLRNNATVRGVLRGLVGLLSILALVWVIRTGHEGARVHWEGVLPDEGSAAVVTDDAPAETTTTTTEPATTTTTEAAATTTEASTTEASTTTTEAEETTTTRDVDPGDIDGMALYESNCARCHGSDGTGGRGPSLVIHLATHADRDAEIVQIVNGGSGMPAFGNRLTTAEIEAVVDYYTDAFGEEG